MEKIFKDTDIQCGLLGNRGEGGSLKNRTKNHGVKEKGRERWNGCSVTKEKGSDLQVADREKMTVPAEGERLFSEVH